MSKTPRRGTHMLVQVPSSIDPLVLSLTDAARFTGMSTLFLRRAARQGRVIAYRATLAGDESKKRNARLLFDRESLVKLIRSFDRADAALRAVEDEAARLIEADLGGKRVQS